jgi:hypothetical protein
MSNLPSLERGTFVDMMQFANMLAKSTMIPREYQNQPAYCACHWVGSPARAIGNPGA